MSLKVSTEPKENRQLTMNIEVDQERVEKELKKAARKLAGQVRIPGFRKGKAPYNVILRQVGIGALYEEFVDELGQEVYREAIEQENIDPYATASLDNIDLEPLRYTLTIPLTPEIKLGDYRSLRVEQPTFAVDEETVQSRLKELLERQSGYEAVSRPSQYGDLISIDVRAVVLDDAGNETDTVVMDEQDWDVTPDQENPMEPAGFDEQLVGMNAGEDKTFEITWPEDSPSMYAGKKVRFTLAVHKIQTYQQPELTDELAQSMGEYETADALVESIRASLREEQEDEANDAYLEKVLGELVAMSELDYPPAAIELQIDQMLRNTDMQMRQMGLQGISQYLQLVGRSPAEYRASQRESAERMLRNGLAIAEVASAEKLSVSEAEFAERLGSMFGALPEDATDEQKQQRQELLEMMQSEGNRGPLEDQIMTEKSIERILAIARGEEIPALAEEPAADTTAADTTAETGVDAPVSDAEGESVPVAEAVAVSGEESESERGLRLTECKRTIRAIHTVWRYNALYSTGENSITAMAMSRYAGVLQPPIAHSESGENYGEPQI